MVDNLIFKDEVFQIIGAAIEIHKVLGPGFLEPVYQEVLSLEFSNRNIPFVSQPELEIGYKGITLEKKYRADFVAFSKIIVEIKAIDRLTSLDEAQLINYLKATSFQLGVLINFGSQQLEWKRRIYTKNPLGVIRSSS